ncbi:PcfJ-like protein [Sphaerotilus mobilis]|uniref:PcfJ-like protein n=2 Tax=Sphaerotilus mobilis TaxID=47994 RepID=A0A4Q7LU06_9BURK|nr:PcfJ-like protein [Sphaerotilus mobilis]
MRTGASWSKALPADVVLTPLPTRPWVEVVAREQAQRLAIWLSSDMDRLVAALTDWLLRELRRRGGVREMRLAVVRELLPDAGVLALARRVHARDQHVRWTEITAQAWNTAVRHRRRLQAIQAEAPALLPVAASLYAIDGLPLVRPRDAVAAVKTWLSAGGLSPSGWRLLLRGGARLALTVRPHYRGAVHDAVRHHLVTLQSLRLSQPPAREVVRSIWSRDGNVDYRWPEFHEQVRPQGAVYGHVARCYAQVKGKTPVQAQAALREALHEVIGWVHGAKLTRLEKNQRRAGWPLLLASATAWRLQFEQLARAQASWPAPPAWSEEGMAFVPIADEHGLIDEGHRMHHCVADRAAACEARRVLILSIRDGAGRRLATAEYQLTQSLPRSLATMRLSLVLGPLNAAVTPAVRKAAERAIEAMRAWWRRSDPGSRVMLLGCDSDNRLWDLQCMTTSHRELITRPGGWRLTEVDSFRHALGLPGLRRRAIDC